MKICKIELLFLFFFEVIHSYPGISYRCTNDICWGCFQLKTDKFFDCICSECPPLESDCSFQDCEFCRTYGKESAFHCLCDTCLPSEKIALYAIIIVCIIVVLVIIIIIICCYCKKRRISNQNARINENIINNININKNNNNNNRNIVININNNINSEGRLNNNNTILDEIFNNEKYLGPKKCKKEYEKYNITCTICLEKFKENIDMICLTPCFHLFHSKCLQDYFRKNKDVKCPNCKFDIIEHYKKQF